MPGLTLMALYDFAKRATDESVPDEQRKEALDEFVIRAPGEVLAGSSPEEAASKVASGQAVDEGEIARMAFLMLQGDKQAEVDFFESVPELRGQMPGAAARTYLADFPKYAAAVRRSVAEVSPRQSDNLASMRATPTYKKVYEESLSLSPIALRREQRQQRPWISEAPKSPVELRHSVGDQARFERYEGGMRVEQAPGQDKQIGRLARAEAMEELYARMGSEDE